VAELTRLIQERSFAQCAQAGKIDAKSDAKSLTHFTHYEVVEGELEVTIDGVVQIAKPGLVAIVPSNVRHSVKALTDGRLIVVDHPARHDFG
jgi:quercetin dioxygenase-like cupin family protein